LVVLHINRFKKEYIPLKGNGMKYLKTFENFVDTTTPLEKEQFHKDVQNAMQLTNKEVEQLGLTKKSKRPKKKKSNQEEKPKEPQAE
jgi:hypothetical protein